MATGCKNDSQREFGRLCCKYSVGGGQYLAASVVNTSWNCLSMWAKICWRKWLQLQNTKMGRSNIILQIKCNNRILPLPVVHYDSQGGTILKKRAFSSEELDPSKSFSAQSPIQVYGGAASIVPVLSEALTMLTCTSSVTQQQQVIHFLQK